MNVSISEAEWQVMRIIWTQQPVDSRTIIDYLAESTAWKPATIKTLLGRLVKKDLVSMENDGKKFYYRARVAEEETVRSATADFFERVCSQKLGHTVAELLQEVPLTKEDIQELVQVLAQKKPVTTIACNCLPGQCTCKDHEGGEHL